jgi:hypothetical protein
MSRFILRGLCAQIVTPYPRLMGILARIKKWTSIILVMSKILDKYIIVALESLQIRGRREVIIIYLALSRLG